MSPFSIERERERERESIMEAIGNRTRTTYRNGSQKITVRSVERREIRLQALEKLDFCSQSYFVKRFELSPKVISMC